MAALTIMNNRYKLNRERLNREIFHYNVEANDKQDKFHAICVKCDLVEIHLNVLCRWRLKLPLL